MSGEKIQVEIIYALPLVQDIIHLRLRIGTTVAQAIAAADVAARRPEMDLTEGSVAVHGRLVPMDTPLRDGDRVEITRPLSADPKEVRHRRVKRARTPR